MQIASERPGRAISTAGLLLSLLFFTQEGCRCQRNRPVPATDGGARPAPTAWLSGSVLDRRDRPVPEARVLAFALSVDGGTAEPAAPFETATDAAGQFRFTHLPAGGYRLLIEAAGFPTAEKGPLSAPSDSGAV